MKQVVQKIAPAVFEKNLKKAEKTDNVTFAHITGTNAVLRDLERRLY
jgi:hypothetical protein